MEGKQFAEAPESRAAWIVVAKVTRLVVFMRSAFPVFKMDLGEWLEERVDRDEVDVSAVVTVGVLCEQEETAKAVGLMLGLEACLVSAV